MLDRHRFLTVADYEICRDIYAATGLRLDPHDAKGCSNGFHALANKFSAPKFDLYFYNFSVGQTLTTMVHQPDYWLTLPARRFEAGRYSLVPKISKFSSPSRDIPVDVHGDHGMIGLRLDGAALNTFAQAYLGVDRLGQVLFEPDLKRRSPIDATIAAQLLAAVECDTMDPGLTRDPLWQERLFTAICANLLAFWPSTHARHLAAPKLGPAPRDVKRVLDYIEAQLSEPLTLAELAEIGGVPVRTLSGHFTRFVGSSPINYIRHRRMVHVHAALASGDYASVTEVSVKYGITSLGRFAGEYRALFGESPSQTLRRAL